MRRLLQLRTTWFVALLMPGLLAGCGGTVTAARTTPSASKAITKAQVLAYARAVNLQAGDIPGWTGSGSEIEAPKPGALALEEIRCSGAVNPDRRLGRIESRELSAGRAAFSEIIKSAVEVWPTPALVAANNNPNRRSRSRACFVRFLRAFHHRVNLERNGRMRIGPFTIATVPYTLPGATNSFLTTIGETRLLSTGAVRAHIYRDLFGFTIGPAEFELEAIGFSHPVPTSIEVQALQLMLNRATTHAV